MSECTRHASVLENTHEISCYLCPERTISFDGFVSYEERLLGVPYWYTEKTCRVMRDGYILYIYDSRASRVLVTHNVTWSRKDNFCKDQYAVTQPEEYPTSPANIRIKQIDPPEYDSGFSRFNFEGACIMDNSLFGRIQCSSEYLGFCFEEQEIASLATSADYTENQLRAIAETLDYFKVKKKEANISTLRIR